LLFLIITLPAYWADWLVSRVGFGAMRILQTEGTLWNGSGNLVIQNISREQFQARISWELETWRLFTGRLQARLSSRNDGLENFATIRAGYHHLSVQDVDTTLPLSILSAFVPAMDLVAPSGRLKITTQQATLTPAGLDGDIQLIWLNAGARMGGLSEAGDYRLVVNGRGATANILVETLRGDIGVTGQGQWQTQGDGLMQLSGNINPGSREQSLRPLFTMLNAQNNNGQYSWVFNYRYPISRVFTATP
jgi:hypothetical protein